MAGLIDTLKAKLGVPGRRKYETTQAPERFPGMSLKEKLQAQVLHFRTINREQRIRRHTTWYLLNLYYQAYQNVDLNPTGSSFDIFEKDDFYVENQFRKHVDTVVNILTKSEGDVVVRPGSDSPTDIATARVSDSVLEQMRDTIEYEKIRHQKNLYKALFGNAFIFTDYIVDKKYGTIVTPKYSYQEVPDPMDPTAEPYMTKVADGQTTRYKGSEIASVCSPLEINVLTDIKGGFTAVPWLQWISRVNLDTVNYLYPELNEQGTMNAVEQDLAQQYLAILGNLPGNVLGDSLAFNRAANQISEAEIVRTWLQPCSFEGDKELLSQFPSGVHIVTVNGRVVDFYKEDLTDRWTHEVLIPLPHSLLGDGLYDALLMQDQINEINSLLIQHMRYTTAGHLLYDPLVVDPKNVINDPKNRWVPANPSMDKSINTSVYEINPGALSQDVGAWLQRVNSAMQDMTSAYDPQTGKGLGANTPYSQSVFLAEKAQSRWNGSVSYNRPELVRFHRQLLDIARKNWVDPRKRASMDNTGQWSFEQFTQADLLGSVDIIITNTDFKPRSRAEQIQGLEMLLQLAPILGDLPPKQKLRIEEMLGLPPDANPTNNQISRAYRQIDRIKKGQVVTPMPMLDDPNIQGPVFQDFMLSEDGEALAESDPQTWANIHTYWMTLMQMGIMQMSSPAGQMIGGMMGKPAPGAPPPNQGTPPKSGGPQPPGGQPGQQGGGPKPPEQQNAQSPVQPQQPMPPPSPTGMA